MKKPGKTREKPRKNEKNREKPRKMVGFHWFGMRKTREKWWDFTVFTD
jgi:hypothetical protein